MQDDNPNHQYDFSSFELELITKMGQKPEGYATAKAVYYAVDGVFSLATFFRRFAEVRVRESIPKGKIPLKTFMQYVSFNSGQFTDIIVPQ